MKEKREKEDKPVGIQKEKAKKEAGKAGGGDEQELAFNGERRQGQ